MIAKLEDVAHGVQAPGSVRSIGAANILLVIITPRIQNVINALLVRQNSHFWHVCPVFFQASSNISNFVSRGRGVFSGDWFFFRIGFFVELLLHTPASARVLTAQNTLL